MKRQEFLAFIESIGFISTYKYDSGAFEYVYKMNIIIVYETYFKCMLNIVENGSYDKYESFDDKEILEINFIKEIRRFKLKKILSK